LNVSSAAALQSGMQKQLYEIAQVTARCRCATAALGMACRNQ
jgi:hypothetical protein